MPNRTARFVSAVCASILAGAPLTAISHGETVTAVDCLSGPKGESPPGSHWYYRIEHATKRHCWYLRGEGEQLSQAAPQNILPPARPPAQQAASAAQHSVANARAELPAQTNRSEEQNAPWPAIAPALNDSPPADVSDTNAALPVVASRWPEPSGVNSTSGAQPTISKLAANVPPTSTAAPAPDVAAGTLVAADASSQAQPGPIPRWFVAVVVPLAFGSLVASLFFKFGRSRRPRRSSIHARRRPVWEQTDDNRIVLSDYPDADVLPRRPRFARNMGEAGEPDNRMAEFLSKMTGRSPT